jgi:2-polyprenyl-3-methyl-5-hydroxy-6-metoxy-1,4-benzoquinol methylase
VNPSSFVSQSEGAPRVTPSLSVLVVIASYGCGNDKYLRRLVQEYQAMSFEVDIVVCSNVAKPVPEGVELIVGMPSRDSWSLPFAHKQVMADRLEDYDLFIYSEDDTLATEDNIRAFLRVTPTMQPDELAGFIRYEQSSDGRLRYCDVNGHYHWEPSSVVKRGDHSFAFFTNEHAAFYILTRDQLRRAIQSGGFLVSPHRGKYDLACTAATDPYTQCGFRKLICISAIEDFLLYHLPNKYLNTRFGTDETSVHKQLNALRNLEPASRPTDWIRPQTRLQDAWYSKDYYEPPMDEVMSEIPVEARRILSIGCGSGETEKRLAERGSVVTAVCLDHIIAACAQYEGVETLWGGFDDLKRQLRGRSFDCILVSNVLHLAPNAETLLSCFCDMLEPGGRCVIVNPNLKKIKNIIGKLRRQEAILDLGQYETSGTRHLSVATLRKWFAGLSIDVIKTKYVLAEGKRALSRRALGVADSLLAEETVVVGRRHARR